MYCSDHVVIVDNINSIYAVGSKKRDDFYKKIFKKFSEKQTSSCSWNWPAFLIPDYWMLYRKMYITFLCINTLYYLTALILCAAIVISLRFVGIFTDAQIEMIMGVSSLLWCMLWKIGIGFLGNKLYYKDVLRRFDKGKNRTGVSFVPILLWYFIILMPLGIFAIMGKLLSP